MLISMNWIEDFVDLSGLDKIRLIKRFTLSTAEVEEIFYKGDDIKGVVSARILSVIGHPDSKKLHLLKVDAGDGIYDVVCGAANVRKGMIVPFAKEGASLGEVQIKKAVIAGFESSGMCCSELELGISAEHDGLMELCTDTPVGVEISELFALRDIVFEVDNKSLTNRPDLWGHYGIAREFAALAGRELKPLETVCLEAFDELPLVDIRINDSDLCYRYSGLKVRNITKKVSPVNMRIRLFYCGTRAINLLADLTNYLMLEMGQPMHAFDCAKVNSIEVGRLPAPFVFETLDGVCRSVDDDCLMICSKGKPVAIAGIMGGLDSEITAHTDSLLLESANFDAVCVRKSSTKIGLRTDASMRYEKTLDPEMTMTAIARFMKILMEIDPGVQVISSATDAYAKKYPSRVIDISRSYIDRITGIEISDSEIVKTLTALGFGVSQSADVFTVSVPSWRATKDVTIKADIIEEITRIYGYDNFKVVTTSSPLAPVKRSSANKCDYFAKDILVQDYKLSEVHSYLWSDSRKLKELGIAVEPNVRLLNAMTPEHDTLRRCMIPTMLTFINENLSFSHSFGIFEIARVVDGLKADNTCKERKKLAIALYSRTKTEKELFFELREIVFCLFNEIKHIEPSFVNTEPTYRWQHPINTAEILCRNEKMGIMCTLHPSVVNAIDKKAAIVAAEIDMDSLSSLPFEIISYFEPSRHPGIDIDLSVCIPDKIRYCDMVFAWSGEELSSILKSVRLIDSFEDKGQKSITLRFVFSALEKNLSKEELQPHIDKILEKLAKVGIFLKK